MAGRLRIKNTADKPSRPLVVSSDFRCVMTDTSFLQEAIDLARDNVAEKSRPFGAVVVQDGAIIARGVNRMDADRDPTAHAELLALRAAGAATGSTRLDGCTVYASGQPCPMCLAAMRLAGVTRVVFAYSNENGAPYGLSTAQVTQDLAVPLPLQSWAEITHLPPEDCNEPMIYKTWAERQEGEA